MVEIMEGRGGIVTQFQGDAILATFNVPVADTEHAANAIHAAMEMLDTVAEDRYDGIALNKEYGTRLLVSESSASQAGDCKLKLFGETVVRGQSHSIKFYTIESFQPDKQNRQRK